MTETVTAIARVCLAVLFIITGYNKLIAIAGTAAYFTKLGIPMPNLAAWGAAGVELVGGLLILVGLRTRWVALVLAAFTAASVYFAHKFWVTPGETTQALKNLAIIGGFLLLFAHGGGRLSLDGGRR